MGIRLIVPIKVRAVFPDEIVRELKGRIGTSRVHCVETLTKTRSPVFSTNVDGVLVVQYGVLATGGVALGRS